MLIIWGDELTYHPSVMYIIKKPYQEAITVEPLHQAVIAAS